MSSYYYRLKLREHAESGLAWDALLPAARQELIGLWLGACESWVADALAGTSPASARYHEDIIADLIAKHDPDRRDRLSPHLHAIGACVARAGYAYAEPTVREDYERALEESEVAA